jgi:hypothetical protein
MFKLKWTVEVEVAFNMLKAKAEGAFSSRQNKNKVKVSQAEGQFKQVHKAITLLQRNPKHQGLGTHEYDSIPNPYDQKKKVFEAYAQNNTPGAYRVFWCYGKNKDEITVIAITPFP